jgi:lipopolysaccharide/colanic/teichoic acid biosynthesis glycosyltransferase
MKRAFDLTASLIGVAILLPLFVVVAVLIFFGDGWPVLFKQTRVGLNGAPFKVLKFRTMYKDAERAGQLTVSGRDPRITPSGYLLRKYKLDELPQLFNVIKGDMSLVGPRPEVPAYVELYTNDQKRVLSVKPGITDAASLEFINENELLADADDPQTYYKEVILPRKLGLQLNYVDHRSFMGDLSIIVKTVVGIIR